MGYHRAGFDVVGVDIRPQPNYPFEFLRFDITDWQRTRELIEDDDFDAIHASPPCQAHTRARVIQGNDHPDLIGPTRELLERTGLPWVIENVEGAPLEDAVELCSASLGLPLCRHRFFELNWPLGTLVPPCARGQLVTAPEHVHHTRKPGSVRGERRVRGVVIFGHNARVESARAAMQMPWATRDEISEAIPPAMTELIGHQLLAHINAKEAVA